MAETNRRRLREIALEQYGFVTTRDAKRLGLTLNALHLLAHRGGLSHSAYSVYRFPPEEIPVTGPDTYMEAVLTVGDDAFLYADAVLALHDLGFVNPSFIRVGSPRRVRKATLPSAIRVVRVTVPAEDLETFEGIPCTTVARALLDAIGMVMPDRLTSAAYDAAERGLLRRADRERVLLQLKSA